MTAADEMLATDAAYFQAWLKRLRIPYAEVGRRVERSASWVSLVARGGYPYDGANRVPLNIWRWAIRYGMPEPPKAQPSTNDKESSE